MVKSFNSNPWSACTNIYKKWTLSLFVCTFCSTSLTWDQQEDREERGTIQDSDIYHLHIHQYNLSPNISFKCSEVTFTVHSSSNNRMHTYRRQNISSKRCHDSNTVQSNHAKRHHQVLHFHINLYFIILKSLFAAYMARNKISNTNGNIFNAKPCVGLKSLYRVVTEIWF